MTINSTYKKGKEVSINFGWLFDFTSVKYIISPANKISTIQRTLASFLSMSRFRVYAHNKLHTDRPSRCWKGSTRVIQIVLVLVYVNKYFVSLLRTDILTILSTISYSVVDFARIHDCTLRWEDSFRLELIKAVRYNAQAIRTHTKYSGFWPSRNSRRLRDDMY